MPNNKLPIHAKKVDISEIGKSNYEPPVIPINNDANVGTFAPQETNIYQQFEKNNRNSKIDAAKITTPNIQLSISGSKHRERLAKSQGSSAPPTDMTTDSATVDNSQSETEETQSNSNLQMEGLKSLMTQMGGDSANIQILQDGKPVGKVTDLEMIPGSDSVTATGVVTEGVLKTGGAKNSPEASVTTNTDSEKVEEEKPQVSPEKGQPEVKEKPPREPKDYSKLHKSEKLNTDSFEKLVTTVDNVASFDTTPLKGAQEIIKMIEWYVVTERDNDVKVNIFFHQKLIEEIFTIVGNIDRYHTTVGMSILKVQEIFDKIMEEPDKHIIVK